MTQREDRFGLQVDQVLVDFVETQALPGTGIDADAFWKGLSDLAAEFDPRIKANLVKRAELQARISEWHRARKGLEFEASSYEDFLHDIGYIVPQGGAFEIETTNVDPEIATIAGPQLVVPITNARYALNAANARWGSLYDALYGTDAIGDLPSGKGYDADRGARVIAWGRSFLDEAVPLASGSWADLDSAALAAAPLSDPEAFIGFTGPQDAPTQIILKNNGLHIFLKLDATTPVGQQDKAGIADIILESALTAIMDCEDSVACVDGTDKVQAYSNWLGLMKGDLVEPVTKGGKTFERKLNDDIAYTGRNGDAGSLKGRVVMLVRNVGELMNNPAILLPDGAEIQESLMDAAVTVLIAKHDLARNGGNSDTGSVYVVKPKMHGPAEVALVNEMFGAVEDMLGLPRDTVKIGIMDEERRTSVNLKECIRAAKSRVAFINTGFLDRTGDEMHTSMEAGPMIRKGEMKGAAWIASYEDRNVDIGLACGLQGRAQIGKGMWAMPDRMADMLDQKVGHVMSGANCAWVPSPTAATLHATHYHKLDVFARQNDIKAGGARGSLADLLTIPTADGVNWSPEDIASEIENNAQGILGYVVRWVDQGVGCSKVPDINNIGLMEDRATCRISSQHLANWLHHGVVSLDEVLAAMQKMAAVVDGQNADDPAYTPMSPGFDGLAFTAACDLVFKGIEQPSGYTEPVLHARRLELKAAAG